MDIRKAIQQSARDRTKLINGLVDSLEDRVKSAQRNLLRRLVEEWVDRLDVKDGKVSNTLHNKRMLESIDTVFERFALSDGLEVAKTIADGVGEVTNFNGRYYETFSRKADVIKIKPQVQELTKAWLGLSGGGKLVENGYLSQLVRNTQVLVEVKNWAMRAVVSQEGFQSMKKGLGEMIQGDPEKLGALQKHYRNFVYDTYSQVDRATAQTYANSLKLRFAIYEGGIIKTTREFCRERNGNVYSRDEIAKMEPESGIPANYNPFTDMGGYGCRHHWNWIPDVVAVMMRPQLVELFPELKRAA